MSDLLKVAGQCEAAPESSRELDLAILRAISGKYWLWHNGPNTIWLNEYGANAPGNPIATLECFTSSIDDAMALMPPGAVWTLEDRLAWVRLLDDKAPGGVAEYQAMAATTPLAICAAILKSKVGISVTVGGARE